MKIALHICISMLLLTGPMNAQIRVINEGFPGENTAELDLRLDRPLDLYKPAFVVIFTGANDALNPRRFLSASDTEEHLHAMVVRAKQKRARVLLITVHEPDIARLMARHKVEQYQGSMPAERVARVNVAIHAVARRDHTALVPFDEVLRNAGGATLELSTDGNHLTAKGYGLLANAVRAKLPNKINTRTTILCIGDSLTYGKGVRSGGEPDTNMTYPSQLRFLLQSEGGDAHESRY